jgi:hypothetical protein
METLHLMYLKNELSKLTPHILAIFLFNSQNLMFGLILESQILKSDTAFRLFLYFVSVAA